MGAKNNTATTTSGPPPQVLSAYNNLLERAQQVGSTPYQQYGGNLLAPFSGAQQSAFNTIDQSQGIAQPYIDQAQQYAQQGAGPVSADQIANYTNPYQQQVVNATIGNINETNAQQQAQVTGNAIAQGALGGDRVGVARAELARQQNLSNAPTLAALNAQGFNTALGAAQQDKARAAQAAFTFGNLGQEAQNTTLQGAQAQLGAGGLQQQQAQAALNIPYQQFQQQQAFPYQQLGWLAGLQTGVGSNLGGTSTTTSPGPNPYSQIAGLGIAAAGMFLKRGGAVRRGYADGGIAMQPYSDVQTYVPTGISITRGSGPPRAPSLPSDQSGSNKMVSDAMGLAKSMRGNSGYSGPSVETVDNTSNPFFAPAPFASNGFIPGGAANGGFIEPQPNGIYIPRGYDDGGMVGSFDDRFGPEIPQAAAADASPLPYVNADRLGLGQPVNWSQYQEGAPDRVSAGIATGPGTDTDEQELPANATPAQGTIPPPPDISGVAPTSFNPTGGIGVNAAPTDAQQPPSKWDSIRPALIAAGLGMLASRSPFFGTALGEGGLQGLSTYSGLQKAERETTEKAKDRALQSRRVDLESARLTDAADRAAKTLAETTRHNQTMENKPVFEKTQDEYGRSKLMMYDPKTRSMIPVPSQGTGEDALPSNARMSSSPTLPPGVKIAPPDETVDSAPSNRNEQFIKDLAVTNPAEASVTKALVEGRLAPPTGAGLRAPYWQKIFDNATQYDPTFDAANYRARAALRQNMKSGQMAQNRISFNTALGHIDALDKQVDKLGNWNVAPGVMNPISQAIRRNVGDKEFQTAQSDFETKKTAVADELAKAFKGTGASNLHDILAWNKTFDKANSPTELHAATKAAVELLESRINAMGETYNHGMGTNVDPLTWLTPKARAVYDRMSGHEQPAAQSATPNRVRQNGHTFEKQPDGSYKAVQ